MVYLAAVRHMHVTHRKYTEFQDQLTPHLQQVIKGIKKSQAATGQARIRRPITLAIMRRMQSTLEGHPHSKFDIMIWAAAWPFLPF